MNSSNIKILFIGAICLALFGGYSVARASYIAMTWNEADGEVIDFEKHTFSCGKGVGECYGIIVGYLANGQAFTASSVKKFNNSKPSHLLHNKITVYYSPDNPGEAILGGEFGPMRNGMWLFIFGSVVLVIFWVVWKKKQ